MNAWRTLRCGLWQTGVQLSFESIVLLPHPRCVRDRDALCMCTRLYQSECCDVWVLRRCSTTTKAEGESLTIKSKRA